MLRHPTSHGLRGTGRVQIPRSACEYSLPGGVTGHPSRPVHCSPHARRPPGPLNCRRVPDASLVVQHGRNMTIIGMEWPTILMSAIALSRASGACTAPDEASAIDITFINASIAYSWSFRIRSRAGIDRASPNRRRATPRLHFTFLAWPCLSSRSELDRGGVVSVGTTRFRSLETWEVLI